MPPFLGDSDSLIVCTPQAGPHAATRIGNGNRHREIAEGEGVERPTLISPTLRSTSPASAVVNVSQPGGQDSHQHKSNATHTLHNRARPSVQCINRIFNDLDGIQGVACQTRDHISEPTLTSGAGFSGEKSDLHRVTNDSEHCEYDPCRSLSVEPGSPMEEVTEPHKETATTSTHKLLVHVDPVKVRNNNKTLKTIFDNVAATGQFNYKGARLPLPSGMRIDNWRRLLQGYHDYKIVDFIEFGWPMGIDRRATLISHDINHTSATAHAADVEHYLATELDHQALLGPFAGPPAIYCHFSPLMTRSKKNSVFRRVIIDLSWPKGYSVNDGISRSEYIDGPMTISLPTPDDMEREVVRVGRGAFLYKTDLSRGYRQLRVDPLDWPYLSFKHGDLHFMDVCPPFGLRSSAMAMQRVSQAIVHLHGRRGFLSRAYINDFGGAESSEPRASEALSALQTIMNALGVAQAESKICLPSQIMTWLGILFNTLEMSMAIPARKMEEIMVCLEDWRGKVRASRSEMLSLLGLLNFVASVAPPQYACSLTGCWTGSGRPLRWEPPPYRGSSSGTSSSSWNCCPFSTGGS